VDELTIFVCIMGIILLSMVIWHDIVISKRLRDSDNELHRLCNGRISDIDRMSSNIVSIADQICIFAELSQTKVDMLRDEREYQHRELMKTHDDSIETPQSIKVDDVQSKRVMSENRFSDDAVTMSTIGEQNGTLL